MRRSLALALVTPALALAACGESDSSKVKDTINGVIDKPATLCDKSTDKILKQAGGSKDACKKLAGAQKAGKKPDNIDVKVDGDKATATFKSQSGQTNSLGLVKDGGDWKIDTVG